MVINSRRARMGHKGNNSRFDKRSGRQRYLAWCAMEQMEARIMLAADINFPIATGFVGGAGLLSINGSAHVGGPHLILTDGGPLEATSVYFTAQQNITGFTMQFDYQITGEWPLGDGFTFVIQRDAITALGVGGGGLGYGVASSSDAPENGGIPNSLAIKFDVFDSEGEGTDSTGLYTNGSAPTLPNSIDLTSTGFNMRSYNPTRAQFNYDGTTLTVVLTDLVSGATATQNYTIDIPAVIGGNNAWLGFTASTGVLTSEDHILNWTFTSAGSAPTVPLAPTNVTVTAGDTQATVSWDPIPDAASYTIKYGTTAGGPYDIATIPSIATTSTTIPGLTNNTPYYFIVSATNDVGEGAYSTEVTATPVPPPPVPPLAPTGLTATAGNGQVTLHWDPVATAASYTIHYGTTSGDSYALTVNNITSTTRTVLSLTNGTPYYFVVSAVNVAGEGELSAESTATPVASAPGIDFSSGFANASNDLVLNGAARIDGSTLMLTDNDKGETVSAWAATPQNITGFTTQFDFQIDGSWPLGDGFTFTIQREGTNAIGQGGSGLGYGTTDTGSGITHSVAVKFDVYDNQGEGTNSTGLYLNGAKPTNTGAINLSNTGINLRSYNMTHALLTYDGTTLTVVLTDLVTGGTATQHYAVNIPAVIGGDTAWIGFTAADGSIVSNQKIANWVFTSEPVIPAVPQPPTGVAAVAGSTQVVLNWNAVPGASSYNIKYGTTNGSAYTLSANSIAGTTFTVTSLTNGTPYYFVVSAVNSTGEGSNSTQVSATPALPSLPSAPTGLTPTSGVGQVALTWNAVPGATSYNIKYGTTSGGSYTNVLPVLGNSGTVTGLTGGVPYFFVVTAVNSVGESINSAQAATTPAIGPAINYPNFAGASGLAINGAGRILDSDLLLNDGSQSKVTSVYSTNQQNITGFTTQFDFLLTGTWPLGDGFTFVIQRAGLSAVGVSGGGLGYGPAATGGTGGIGNSIAVKFDLFDNAGEGNNSTGLYVNGEAPILPHSIWLGNTSLDLRSYDTTRANITYDGTTLTVVLTDLRTGATATQSYTIDIPATIGGSTAWIGFTSSTGHMTSDARIQNWSFTSVPVVPVAPAAPTGLSSAPGTGQIALSWNAIQGASSYVIKYGTTPGGPYTGTLPVAGTSGTVAGLTNGTPYYFTVAAVNGAGQGNLSSEITATPAAPSLPSAPAGVAPVAGNGQVALSWNAVAGATSYIIKYGTTSGGPYISTISGITGTSNTITGLNGGTPYYFVVAAVNSVGTGANSVQATATPAIGPQINYTDFTGATGLTFNNGVHLNGPDLMLSDNTVSRAMSVYANNQVNITGFNTQFDFLLTGTWPLGDGFTFVIQRAGTNALGVGGGGLGYGASETGGTGGINHSIAVKFDVYDNQGEGTNSTGLYTNGEAPTLPHAIWLGDTNFDFRSYDVTHANITYDGTTLTVVLTDTRTGASVTQHYAIDIPATIGGTNAWVGFTAGTGHMAVDARIKSWSFTSAPPVPTPPVAPSGLAANPASTQVALTWNPVADATSYIVHYGTTSGGPYTGTLALSGNSGTVTGLNNGTPYYFVVTAVNGVGEGNSSSQVASTPLAPSLPNAPASVATTAGNAQATLSWDPVPGATSYTIKYGTTSGSSYSNVITDVTLTTANFTNLTNGTTYYFVVTAVNDVGSGADSAQASATPISGPALNFNNFTGAAGLLVMNGSVLITDGKLRLTTNNNSELSSVYAAAQQSVAHFNTQFDFVIDGSWPLADGFTFVIQRSGPHAIGQSGAGLGYGATNLGDGIANSIAIKFDIYDSHGEGTNSTGLYLNGATPTDTGSVNLNGTGVDLRSYHLTHASIIYDGTTLTVTLTDTVTQKSATQHYTIDIPATIGGSIAWVGFTAADSSIVSNQTIWNWTYTPQ